MKENENHPHIQSNLYYMGKYQFQPIGTFEEFCLSRKQIRENNSSIKVEVEWWDEAIDNILARLRSVAGNPIDWERLLDYCRAKFQVLSRDTHLMVEEYVLAHIKDLLFENYGDALFSGDDLSSSYKASAQGTRMLVISQLGDEILRRVKKEAGLIPETEKEEPETVATVSLDNWMPEDEFCETRHVKEYQKFSSLLNESVYKLRIDNYDACLDYTLDTIEKEAGSLNFLDVLKKACENPDAQDKIRMVGKYIFRIADGYLSPKSNIELLGEPEDGYADERMEVINQAKDVFCEQIVSDVLQKIQEASSVKK